MSARHCGTWSTSAVGVRPLRRAWPSTINLGDITVVILTRDEERNLPRALSSLPKGVRVLVVDAESCDRTVEFAQANGARTIVRPWAGFVEARTFALAEVTTPWTFVLDADEALDDRLSAALAAADGKHDGYLVSRDTSFCGKIMRMWKGEQLLRLFRTGTVRVEAAPAAGGEAALHERYVCSGSLGALAGTLFHYSYPDASTYHEKYARYTSLEAEGLQGSPSRLIAETLKGAARFAWLLFRRGAVLDGARGIHVAYHSAMYSAVVARKAL